MRIIPIILILLFTVGCTTVKVREHYGEKSTKLTTSPELTIKKEKALVEKKTEVASVLKPAIERPGNSVKKKIKEKRLPKPVMHKEKDISEKETEVTTVPQPATDTDKAPDYAPSDLPAEPSDKQREAAALSYRFNKRLALAAAGASIVLGLLALFKLMRK